MRASRGWRLYLWEPTVSPHKLGLFDALAKSPAVEEITYIAEKPLTPERRELGWAVPEPLAPERLIIAPDKKQIHDIVSHAHANAIHIFSGIHWVPCIESGIAEAIRLQRHFGLMHEARAFEGLKGWARLAHSWITEGALRRSADFVLAIGRHGPRWFASAGYQRRKIFPFAYFLPYHEARHETTKGATRICFLGRLTQDKGLPLFLDALHLTHNHVHAEIAGTGPEEPAVEAAVHRSGGALRHRGVLAMKDVPAFLAQTDVLVLPSRTKQDGWGAAITEALLQGAAVVATDLVGGSICLDDRSRGRVVKRLSPLALARAIDDLIDGGLLTVELRQHRSEWAQNHLTDTAGARYLLDILSHLYQSGPRPPPFYA